MEKEQTDPLRIETPPAANAGLRWSSLSPTFDDNSSAANDDENATQMDIGQESLKFAPSTVAPDFLERNAHVHEWIFGR